MGGGADESIVNLRVAGSWTGFLHASLDWSGAQLRAEASRCSGFDAETINLIAAGRNIKDSDCLRNLKVHANSKLLMTRVGSQVAAPVMREAERADRLSRVRAAAEALAAHEDGDFRSLDEYNLSLTNQNGEALSFKNTSVRRAVIMGLIFHNKARKLIQDRQYAEALEVLNLSEESFVLCEDKELLQNVDNLPFIQIDIVWCLFMLRDIGKLKYARQRLAEARSGLRRAHGSELERLHVLQGGFCPELAIYVRLALLEGVAAYHSGLPEIARVSLLAARDKFQKLQVPDESLAMLVELGFNAKDATRALRVSGQDVNRAVAFLMEQRELRKKKREEDLQFRKERKEQKRYGRTKSGKAVDIKELDKLVTLGYERVLVAEALRRSDNDTNAALDLLSDPGNFEDLQKRRKRTFEEAELNGLMQMGFSREVATRALESSADMDAAVEKLLASSSQHADRASSANAEVSSSRASGASASDPVPEPRRDVEMENEIVEGITGDVFEEYDIDVAIEGEAIAQYLCLLDTPDVNMVQA